MSARVSSFERLKVGDFDYLFIVVHWSDYTSRVNEEINKQFEPFGKDLGLKGQVIAAYKESALDTAEQVTSKDWPNDVKEKWSNSPDPALLIINTDFVQFNPSKDPYAIVWFSDYTEKPDQIYKLFTSLAKKVKTGEDIFEYLKSESKKKGSEEWMNCIEIKPGIWGFKIDGKAILKKLRGIGK